MMQPVRIDSGEVHVWMAETGAGVHSCDLQSCLELLSSRERLAAGKLRIESRRVEYVVAHALVRTVLSRYCAVDPRRWSFHPQKYGKPRIARPAVPTLRFNLSHTDGLAVCAIARAAIGVDAERIVGSTPAVDMARRFFSSEEADRIAAHEPNLALVHFTELWTLKEAFLKALGCGLRVGLDRFGFTVREGPYPRHAIVRNCLRESKIASRWNFVVLRPSEEHLLSVAMPALESVVLRRVPVQALGNRPSRDMGSPSAPSPGSALGAGDAGSSGLRLAAAQKDVYRVQEPCLQ